MTSEVLAPGTSNEQASVEYYVHDVGALLRAGSNALGVELGKRHGVLDAGQWSHQAPLGGPDYSLDGRFQPEPITD